MLARQITRILDAIAEGAALEQVAALVCAALAGPDGGTDATAAAIYVRVPDCDRLAFAAASGLDGATGSDAARSDLEPGAARNPSAATRGDRPPASDPRWRGYCRRLGKAGLAPTWIEPVAGGAEALAAAVVLFGTGSVPTSEADQDEARAAARLLATAIERYPSAAQGTGKASTTEMIVDNINHGIGVFDRDLRLIHFNETYRELYEMPEGLLASGRHYGDIIRFLAERGEYGDVEPEAFVRERLVEMGKVAEHRNLRHRPDGTAIAIYRKHLPDGRILITFTDITAEVQAENDRRRNADLLASTVENLDHAIKVVDAEGRLVLWNRLYTDMFGWPEDMIRVGTMDEDLVRLGNRERGKSTEEIDEAIAARRRRIDSSDPSSRIRTFEDGRVISQKRAPMPGGGYVTTYTDITPLRHASEEAQRNARILEATVQNLDHAIKVIDGSGRLVLWNRKYQQMMRLPDEVMRKGVPYLELVRESHIRRGKSTEGLEEIVAKRLARNRRSPEASKIKSLPNGITLQQKRCAMPDGGFVTTYTDITPLMQAERALQEKSALLQMTQDHMGQGICVYDSNFRIVNFNQRWVELFELPPEIARIGTSFEEFMRFRLERGDYGPCDVDALVRQRLERIKSSKPYRHEFHSQDGRVIAIRRTPMPDGGTITTYTDVTERWKIQQELENKNKLFETALSSMNQGFAIHDADHRLLVFNENYANWRDKLPKHILRVGATHEEIVRFRAERGDFGPGDVDTLVADRIAAMDRGEMNSPLREVDGRVIHGQREKMPDGGTVTTYTDITERWKIQQELENKNKLFETALSSMNQGFAIHDAEQRLVAFNQKYVDWRGNLPEHLIRVGVTHEEVIRYRAERGDYGAGDIDTIVQARLHAMNAGKIYTPYRVVRGRVIHAHREKMPDGGCVTIYNDITEAKQVEEELIRSKEEAEAANRAKTEFLANMSHELRTPLNAVIGFSEILMSESFGPLGDPRYKDYVTSINDSGAHLLSLINDILDLSRIEEGKVTLEEEEVDLAETVESSLVFLRDMAEASGIRVSTQIPYDLPCVRADKRRLKQIIINLVQNAIKFSRGRGDVRAEITRKRGAGIALMVRDSGIGMAPEEISRALERFAQIETGLKRRFDGAGLGLPLARGLIELHGGTIDIRSVEGEGTDVIVTLPEERILPPPQAKAASR